MFNFIKRHPFLMTNVAILSGLGARQYYVNKKHPASIAQPLALQDESVKMSRSHEQYYNLKTREQHLEEMEKHPDYDVLVIGGGCVGAGAVLDAASRGLKCLLIEQKDFASGTSSKSTKLFHGGVRYLQQVFEFSLAGGRLEKFNLLVEALRERSYTVENAKYQTKLLPIVVPCKSWWEMMYYYAGTLVYYGIYLMAKDKNCLAKFDPPAVIGASELQASFPHLDKSFKWGVIYQDGQNNDSRYLLDVLLTSTIDNYVPGMKGANIFNYMAFKEFIKDSKGKITGAVIEDRSTGKEYKVKTKVVLNCTGVFADQIRLKDDPKTERLIHLAVGSHITLPGSFCNRKRGIILPETADGRVIFILPWLGHSLVGTTDLPHAVAEHDPAVTIEEMAFLVNELSKIYPSQNPPLISSVITSRWAGLRPLVKDISVKKEGNTKAMSRKHVIEISDSGLVSIMGGKWTIYRTMGEDGMNAAAKILNPQKAEDPAKAAPEALVVEREGQKAKEPQIPNALPPSKTKNLKLIGEFNKSPTHFAGGKRKEYVRFFAEKVAKRFDVDEATAKYFVKKYGDRTFDLLKICEKDPAKYLAQIDENFKMRYGEIVYQIRYEMAARPVDILFRRNRVGFIEQEHVRTLLPKICDIYQDVMNLPEAQKEQLYTESMAELKAMHL